MKQSETQKFYFKRHLLITIPYQHIQIGCIAVIFLYLYLSYAKYSTLISGDPFQGRGGRMVARFSLLLRSLAPLQLSKLWLTQVNAIFLNRCPYFQLKASFIMLNLIWVNLGAPVFFCTRGGVPLVQKTQNLGLGEIWGPLFPLFLCVCVISGDTQFFVFFVCM